MSKKILKKVLVSMLALVFASAAFAGCCTWTATDGTETKSFSNCFKTAQDKACNPPVAVMTVINAAAPLIASILNLAVPGSSVFISASNALQWVTTLQKTGCLALTDLNKLIAYLQSADFTQGQALVATSQMKKGLHAAAPIEVQPLVDWKAKY
jgi:curli biogenesis system outer membrane secretion channel CsgG